MSEPKFTNEELIIATVASLKKWENVSKDTNSEETCGFCILITVKGFSCILCPAEDICVENTEFWNEISINPRKRFNPGKYKYQQRRIQKNIDWLNDYLKELQE